MQKIFIGLVGLLLVGIFFFIQNKEKKTNNVRTPLNTKTSETVITQTKRTQTNQKINNKSFQSTISLTHDVSEKGFTEADKKELESKSERELKKDIFADIQSRMIKEMQTIPSCLENAQNKHEALLCNQKLDEVNKEFELLLGITTDTAPQNNNSSFVWNETTKEKMIKEIDAGIEPMQSLFSCLQSADNDTEEEKCFDISDDITNEINSKIK